MRLSSESRLACWTWMACIWLAIAAVLAVSTQDVGRYFTRVGEMGLNGRPVTTPLQSPTFSFAADAQTWIRYALQLDEAKQFQLRYTHIDNAPYGRQVHWNSAWAWTIAGAGELRRYFTHEPITIATERSALWLNSVVLFVIVVLLSAWAACRGGAVAGILVALGMVASNRFYEGFIPSYVDHHGLLTASAFALTLGVVFMGAGWWAPDRAATFLPQSAGAVRRAAVVSAVCGAIGLWISAASIVPPIAFVGIAGLMTAVIRGRPALLEGAIFDPRAWRLWGITGCGMSLFFYALEYFPSHLGMRLEVNHPLYAFAWWGGAEIVAQIGEWRVECWKRSWVNLAALGLAAVALLAVPTVVLIGRDRVFLPLDPFLASLHHDISEFLSLPRRIRLWGFGQVVESFDVTAISLFVAMLILGIRHRRANVLGWFSVFAALAFVGIGIWQERWLLSASGPLICMALVTIALLAEKWRLFCSRTIVLLIVGVMFVPTVVVRVRNFRTMASGHVDTKDALQPLFRNIAVALRASQPQGDIVMLASPNTSTSVGYYGRFKTIGTLYWENDDGLKAAAQIFSAHTDDEAAKLIKERGITHIAMVSEENFIEPYYSLLHPSAPASDVKLCFGYRLLVAGEYPSWLEVLPYNVPPDLQALNVKVLLFKVAFSQSVADAVYHLAVAQMAWGQKDAADKTLDRLIQLAPNAPQPWLRKCELLMSQGKFGGAAAAVERAIGLAPESDRARLYDQAGQVFFEKRATSFAVQMYRSSLNLGFDPVATYSLSWLLATAKDASIRNGTEAVRLAEAVVKLDPNSIDYLNCLAAGLAECGKFDQAVEVAKKVIAVAGQNSPALPILNAHLTAYENHLPWRE